jgi:hypothetical protein
MMLVSGWNSRIQSRTWDVSRDHVIQNDDVIRLAPQHRLHLGWIEDGIDLVIVGGQRRLHDATDRLVVVHHEDAHLAGTIKPVGFEWLLARLGRLLVHHGHRGVGRDDPICHAKTHYSKLPSGCLSVLYPVSPFAATRFAACGDSLSFVDRRTHRAQQVFGPERFLNQVEGLQDSVFLPVSQAFLPAHE